MFDRLSCRRSAPSCLAIPSAFRAVLGVCLLAPFWLQAATYHVSSEGSDLASGTTEIEAWATIERIARVDLQPGDEVLFRRGDTWTGVSLTIPASGTSDAPVRFGAYGDGAKPILAGASGPGIGIFNRSQVVVEDLAVFEPSGQGVSIEGSEHIIVRRVDVTRNGSGPGINAQRGGWIHIDGCVVVDARSNGIQFRGSVPPEIHDSIVENCTVMGTRANDGIVIHADGGLQAGSHFVIRNNVSVGNAEQGYDVTTGEHVLLEGNRSIGNLRGGFDINHFARHVTVLYHKSEDEPVLDTAQTMKIGVPDVTVAYSKFLGPVGVNKPIIKIQAAERQPENVALHNNLFVWQHASGGQMIQLSAGITMEDFSMRNNIMTSSGAARGTIAFAESSRPPSHPGYVIDTNLYFAPGGAQWIVNGVSHTFDSYRTTFGRDANGMEADPQFVDASAGDYGLVPLSPAVDAGADLGMSRDLVGTWVPQFAGPDIGPYEYFVPVAAPSGLVATAVSTNRIDLSWTDNASDETAFRIQRRADPDGDFADTTPATVGANVAQFSDTSGVQDGATYFYQVRAEAPSGYSDWSNEAVATTPAEDRTPPVFTALRAEPFALWSPNHRMVPVTVLARVVDDQDDAPHTRIVSVSSNEPADCRGDHRTAIDWEITGDLTLKLRAERSGHRSGRIYTITVASTDLSGNTATAHVLVTVPHRHDSRAPQVDLASPARGAFVGGANVVLRANASDNVGVIGVQFRIDGAPLGLEDTDAPFALEWDTTALPDGPAVITAVARDASGNIRVSKPAFVMVDNTPPTVSVAAPSGGSLLTGPAATLTAIAGDDVALVGVSFSLDGVRIGEEDMESPYEAVLDTTTVVDGSHVLSATARDRAGNATVSAGVTVLIDNLFPVVEITAPEFGVSVGASPVLISATASDEVGVAGVRFRLNGADLGDEDLAAPYTVVWDPSGVPEGSYVNGAKLSGIISKRERAKRPSGGADL